MALTLLSNPENVHFARNPAIVKLRADQDGGGTLFDAVGITAHLEYTEPDRFATNETITVEYTEPDGTTQTQVFTAKASPAGSNQFYDAAFGGTDLEYWIFIKDLIADHPRIAPFIDVYITSSGGEKLNFQLRSASAGWDLDVTNAGGFTITLDAAVADATPENYKALLDVFFENTYREGDYAQAARLEGLPEAGTGYVYFDLSAVLSAECRAARSEPLVPEWGTNTPFLGDNMRRWYFRYTEQYGAPVAAQPWTYGIDKTAYDGGVSQARYADGDFLADMDGDNALLTWMPDGKSLALEQPEYLTWYNHTSATRTVYLRVVWYNIADGTTSSPTDYFTPGLSVLAGESAVFPVWPALFGLDAETDAYKYTVQVGYTSITFSALSQARSYYIDRDYYESERHLVYLNGFGVPETWRCTGEIAKRLRVQRQTAERPLSPGYNELASDRYQHARSWDVELTYRTGYLTKTQADALQELLIAGEVYDVSETGYIPLQITSSDFRVTETRQELHAYEFSAVARLNMKNYSRKTLTTAGSDAWLDEAGDPWWDELEISWQNE